MHRPISAKDGAQGICTGNEHDYFGSGCDVVVDESASSVLIELGVDIAVDSFQ
jgi:hypothetical protein